MIDVFGKLIYCFGAGCLVILLVYLYGTLVTYLGNRMTKWLKEGFYLIASTVFVSSLGYAFLKTLGWI